MDIITGVSNTIYYAGKALKLKLRQGNGNKSSVNIYRVSNIFLERYPEIPGMILKEVTEFESRKSATWNQALTLLKKSKSIVDLDSVRDIVTEQVSIPVMINDQFDVSKIYGTAGSEDQTFVTSEYLDTIAISVAIQICLPLIITSVNTMLLSRTPNIMFIVLGNLGDYLFGKYIRKLKLFINTIAGKVAGKRHNRVIRLNDVPEEDLPSFILGNILLLRMPGLRYEEVDYRVRPTNAWPINSFKRAIENTMRMGTMGSSSINDKTPPTEQDGVTKLSSLDDSLVTSLISTDQVIAAEYALEQDVLHDHLGIPKSRYHEDLIHTFTVNTTELTKFNLEVMKLVLFYVFPYGMVSHMESKYLTILQTVTTEWLLHHGLIDLAYMMCSRPGVGPHRLGAYRSVEDTGIMDGLNDYLKDLINLIRSDSVFIMDHGDMLVHNNFRDNVTKASLAKELSKLLVISENN